MAIWSVLLRVLLSLGLILNGSTFAMASMPDGNSHAGMQHMVAAPAQGLKSPCHEGEGTATAVASAIDGLVSQAAESPKPSAPDCCISGACRCLCAQQCVAFVAVSVLREPVTVHANVSWPVQASHAAPVLPHLMRPPIS